MQTFTFKNGHGHEFKATLDVVDAEKAARCLAARITRRQTLAHGATGKATGLDGGVVLTLERI